MSEIAFKRLEEWVPDFRDMESIRAILAQEGAEWGTMMVEAFCDRKGERHGDKFEGFACLASSGKQVFSGEEDLNLNS